MKAVRIDVDADANAEAAIAAIVDGLEPDTRVAVVEPLAANAQAAVRDGAIPRVRIGEETVVRSGLRSVGTIDEAIDALADAGVDVALVVGFEDVALETVHLGRDERADVRIEPGADGNPEVAIDAFVDRLAALEDHETLPSLIAGVERHPDADKAGAIATFTGRVRAENRPEARTTHLEYEKYDEVADDEMEAIRRELTAREGVYEVLFHHRTGVVEAGEDAVYVVVLAGHRAEAFAAVSDGIDLLKARVPIFKKEVTETGEFWAHDRP